MRWRRRGSDRWSFPRVDAMSRRRKWEEEEAPPVRAGFWARFRYLFLIALTLFLILYAAGQAMARTAGFRDLIGQRLETLVGMPVKIEGSSVNWRFDLTLLNLVTEGTKRPDSPGLRVRRIHLAWSFDRWWRNGIGLRAVELDHCSVVFKLQDDGDWAPREFRVLGELMAPWLEFDLKPKAASPAAAVSTNEASPSVFAGADQWPDRLKASGTRFAMSDSQVIWWDGASTPRASVEGVGIWMTPAQLPGRTLQHLKMSVDQASAQTGNQVRNLRVEVLDVGTQKIVLGFEAERQQGPADPVDSRP